MSGERKSQAKRRILRIGLGLAAFLLLGLAALPWLLDSALVRNQLGSRLSELLVRDVTIEAIDASWTGGLELRGVSVRGRDPALAGKPLLAVRQIAIEASPLELLTTGDPGWITLDGLAIQVESSAGGRTNIDDLVRRLLAPAPPREPRPPPIERPPPPAEPTPLRVRLKSGSVLLRYLPHRTLERRIDPFREDPEVWPADAGAVVVGLTDLDAELELVGGRLRGQVTARSTDLSAIEGLRGRISLQVSGAYGDGLELDIEARADDLRVANESEPWLELRASVRQRGNALEVRSFGLASQSERIRLEAAASLDLGDPLDSLQGTILGKLPAAPLLAMLGRHAEEGWIEFEAAATPETNGARVRATVASRGLPAGDYGTEIDVSVLEGGDRLVVHPSRVADLALEGRLSGLLGERPLQADGWIKGTLPLDPLDLDRVEGTLDIDALVATEADGVHLQLKAVAADSRLRIEADLRESDRTWSGVASVHSDLLTVEADRLRAGPGGISLRGRVETTNVDAVLRAIPDFEVPESLEFDGTARFEEVQLHHDGSRLMVDTRLESDRLTFLIEGVEVLRDEPLTGDIHLVTDGSRFDFRKTRLEAPQRKLTVLSHELRVREDGSWSTSGVVDGPLTYLPQFVPELDWTAVSGTARLDVVLSDARLLKIEAKGIVPDFMISVGEKSMGGKLDLDLAGAVGRDGVRVDRCVASLGGTTLNGTATLADRSKVEMDLQGDLEPLFALLPHTSGAHRAGVHVAYLGPMPGRPGEVAITGSLEASKLEHPDASFERLKGDFSLVGKATDEGIDKARLRFRGSAERLEVDALTFEESSLDAKVSGSVRNGDFGPGFDFHLDALSKRLDLDGVLVLDARSRLDGRLRRGDLEPGKTGKLEGNVAIATIRMPSLEIRNGRAQLELNHGILGLRDFRAEVNEGRVQGSGRFDVRSTPIRWEVDAVFEELQLREELGNPLSLLIPIVRLTPLPRERVEEHRTRLSGTIGANLRLSGTGFEPDTLKETLAGRGTVSVDQAAVQGSLLIPLIHLRVDSLLFGLPFEFRDTVVHYTAEHGIIKTAPFKLKSAIGGFEMKGTADLRGSIDFLIRSTLWRLPFSVSGDWEAPKVKAVPFARME